MSREFDETMVPTMQGDLDLLYAEIDTLREQNTEMIVILKNHCLVCKHKNDMHTIEGYCEAVCLTSRIINKVTS
jgi:hypothetical protein